MGDVLSQGLQLGSDMIRRIAGPLADEIGETIGVHARGYRIKQAVKVLKETQRMLIDAGISPHAVPPRLFLPIVESASVQDDEDLHMRWAALLANAAAIPDSVHPSYIEVLRQLTPKDAKLLDELYDECMRKGGRRVQAWSGITWAERERRTIAGENTQEQFDNLVRVGLIATEYELDDSKIKVGLPQIGRGGVAAKRVKVKAQLDSADHLTDFAMRFVKACRAPTITIEAPEKK